MSGPRWTRGLSAAVVAAVLIGAVGCDDTGPVTGKRGGITVLAAASLTEPFTLIGADFEAANPGVRVSFSFAGSARLAQQIHAGAPADVFAAADRATMRRVVSDAVGPPRVFARNQLVIAVAEGNPKGIDDLADLGAAGVTTALCAAQVPCGAAARRALDAAGVTLTPATLEQDVKAALTKVRLGEVDAALVYRTDARTAEKEVDAVEFPQSAAAVNDYPIVALTGSRNPAAAEAFVAYVLSVAGRRTLTAAGFQVP